MTSMETVESYDANGAMHSVGDKPFSDPLFPNEPNWIWYRHGLVHRDGGKPAVISKTNTQLMSWYEDGCPHRGGDLPANIDAYYSTWYVRGVIHRALGPANIIYKRILDEKSEPRDSCEEIKEATFALYGALVSEDTFKTVHKTARENNCPLWISWFIFLEIITLENIQAMKDEGSFNLPALWVLKASGVTEENLKSAYHAAESRFKGDILLAKTANTAIGYRVASSHTITDKFVESIIDIIEFETTENRSLVLPDSYEEGR